MTLSLRLRVLLLLLAVNVAVVGGQALYLARGLVQNSTETADRSVRGLVSAVRGQIRPGTGVNAVKILGWTEWEQLADVLIVDRRIGETAGGRLYPQGLALNPRGSAHRPADFDHQGIYGAIRLAVAGGEPVENVAGGTVLPIEHESGVWGGVWYRIDPQIDINALITRFFLPTFLVSTLLISLVTFSGLRRFVLEPVERLAAASRRIAAGDHGVEVEELPHKDELSELVRAFNAMTLEMREAEVKLEREVSEATAHARQAEAAAMTQRRLAATGELAAGIAHEINNPLGGLQNAVEALGRADLPEAKRAQYLALLQGGLERIRATVGQLLRFTPRRQQTALVAVDRPAEGVALVVEVEGTAHAVTWQPETWPEELRASLAALQPIRGEEGELGQAVLNLLVNALDALGGATHGSPRIEVRLERPPHELRIRVADNGPGVEPEVLDRVRDLFFTTKEVGQGSGLGLAIVHNVVESHGGRLELESRPGQGFAATLVLPEAPGTTEGPGSGPDR